MENDATIAQICLITGLDPEEAVNALELADGNVETAIQMYFDGTLNVRATTTLNEPSTTTETSQSEQSNEFFDSAHDLWEFTNETDTFQSLESQLMFNIDPQLSFKGHFRNAISFSKESNRWLLINIQNVSQFPCHCLNRDVWNNIMVKNLVRDNFVFYQTYHELRVGAYLDSLYNQEREYPFVAVLDPRTREMVLRVKQFVCDDVVSILYDFVEVHPNPIQRVDEVVEPLLRRLMDVETDDEDVVKDAFYKLILPDNKEVILNMDFQRTVRHLLKMIVNLGYKVDSHKVMTTLPPLDLTQLGDYDVSLQKAGLQKRQRIIVAPRE